MKILVDVPYEADVRTREGARCRMLVFRTETAIEVATVNGAVAEGLVVPAHRRQPEVRTLLHDGRIWWPRGRGIQGLQELPHLILGRSAIHAHLTPNRRFHAADDPQAEGWGEVSRNQLDEAVASARTAAEGFMVHDGVVHEADVFPVYVVEPAGGGRIVEVLPSGRAVSRPPTKGASFHAPWRRDDVLALVRPGADVPAVAGSEAAFAACDFEMFEAYRAARTLAFHLSMMDASDRRLRKIGGKDFVAAFHAVVDRAPPLAGLTWPAFADFTTPVLDLIGQRLDLDPDDPLAVSSAELREIVAARAPSPAPAA